MAKKSEGWSEEKCLQLIREFRKRPILWDQKSPLFYRKRVKASAWIEISNILQMPPDSCTRKMSILMSSFRREKAKIVHTLKHDISPTDASLSSWFGFEEMSFMLDKESERQRKKTGMVQLPSENRDDEDDDDPNIDEESSSTSPVMVPVPVPVQEFEPPHTSAEMPKYLKRSVLEIDQRRKKKKIKKLNPTKPKIDEPAVEQARVEKEPPKSQNNEEEIKYFSNFIATKMMKYSETTKNAVQQGICDIIFQADQGKFESTLTKEKYMSSCEDPLKHASGTGQMPSSSDMIKVYYSDSDESN